MKKNFEKAFTLIELLVVMGIGSVIGIMLISFLVQQNGIFYQQNSKLNQGVSLNNVMSEINDSIRLASGVATSYVNGTTTYSSSTNTLVLSYLSIDQNGDPIENTYDYLIITKDSTTGLVRKLFFPNNSSFRKSQNKVLLTKASLLSFSYLNKNNLIVSPTAAAKVNVVVNLNDQIGLNKTQSSSASATVSLRNF